MNIPDVLDYLPIERVVMCGLIIAFSSVQISLALHNETLREAVRAHREFIRNNLQPVRLVPAHLRCPLFLF